MKATIWRFAAHAPKYVRNAPPPAPNTPKWQVVLSKFLGANMSFWVLYRLKQDWKVTFGIAHPWDNH